MSAQPRTAYAPGARVLALAARALEAVVRNGGCTAEVALRQLDIDAGDRGAVRALHSGTLRWYLRLAPLVESLLEPGQRMAPQVAAALAVALHQIEYSRARPESVVNIAVDAVRALGEAKASGFANALLRRYLRERDALNAGIDRSEPARLAHPRWLLKALRAAWPQDAAHIVEANNEQPPLVLRVNLARDTREAALARLAAAGIGAEPGAGATSIVLAQALDVKGLARFQRRTAERAGCRRAARRRAA